MNCNKCIERSNRWKRNNPDKAKEYQQNRERKEYRKEYSKIEIYCDTCTCPVRKCRWSKHILTQKHLSKMEEVRKEEEMLGKMNEEERDENVKIMTLKTIWKFLRL